MKIMRLLGLALLALLIASAAMAGPDYPEEIKAIVDLYPGANILAMQRDSGAVQVIMTVPDPAAKVMAHYKTALTGDGWGVDQEMAAGPVTGLVVAKNDKRFLVSVMDNPGEGDPTMVTLSIEPQ